MVRCQALSFSPCCSFFSVPFYSCVFDYFSTFFLQILFFLVICLLIQCIPIFMLVRDIYYNFFVCAFCCILVFFFCLQGDIWRDDCTGAIDSYNHTLLRTVIL